MALVKNKPVYKESFLEGLEPERMDYPLHEWSDDNIVLTSEGSSEPGPYSTKRTPYMKKIMECLSPSHPCSTVVFMKPAQVGASQVGVNWSGYTADITPAPMLIVQPTDELAKRFVKQRIDPMIQATEKIAKKIENLKKTKGKKPNEKMDTLMYKRFPGGSFIFAGANSPVKLRSAPCRFIYLDEPDAYPEDVGREGSPVKLAIARCRAFPNSKVFLTSTPTIRNHSVIEREFLKSNQQHYYVPCPHCEHKQVLVFKNLKGFKKGDYSNVHYVCKGCGEGIKESHKRWMLENGEWIAHKPEIEDVQGFHMNALNSPPGWFSWADIAREWDEAQNDVNELKYFINTVLAETWEEKAECPDYEDLYNRKENYEIGKVPEGVYFLTAGIDIQRDRFEMEVVGWGKNKESWSIDYKVVKTDTTDFGNWHHLDKMVDRTFEHAKGYVLGLRNYAVDSGDQTQMVYNWARNKPKFQCSVIKGIHRGGSMVTGPKKADFQEVRTKKRIYAGVQYYMVAVNLIKEELYGFLRGRKSVEDEHFPYGYCHFPDYPLEYFKQLTSEEKISVMKQGRMTSAWRVKHGIRNEALDCRVYARAAAYLLNLDLYTDEDWKKEDEMINELIHFQNKKEATRYNRNQGGVKRRKTDDGWLSR